MKNRSKLRKPSKSVKKTQKHYLVKSLFVLAVLLMVGLFSYRYAIKVEENTERQRVVEESSNNQEMTPEQATVNLVTAGKILPMSDDPTLNAMAAANKVYLNPPKQKTQEEVDKVAMQAAEQAARDTIVVLSNVADSNVVAKPNSALTPEIKKYAAEAVTSLKDYVIYTPNQSGVVQPVLRTAYDLIGKNSSGSPLCVYGKQEYVVGSKIRDKSNCYECTKSTNNNKETAKMKNIRCSEVDGQTVGQTANGKCVVYKSKDGNSFSQNKTNRFSRPVIVPNNSYVKVIDGNGTETRWKCSNGRINTIN